MRPGRLDLPVYAGEPRVYRVTFTQEDGSVLALSGTWAAQTRKRPDDADSIDIAVDATNQATGVLVLTVPGDQFARAEDVRLWDLQGSVFGTVLAGKMPVTPDITDGAAGAVTTELVATLGPDEVRVVSTAGVGPQGPPGEGVPDATGQAAGLAPLTDGAGAYVLGDVVTPVEADAAFVPALVLAPGVNGVVGDGAADDLAAFTAGVATPGVVLVTSGTYRLSNGITVAQGTSLVMEPDATLFIDAAATSPGVTIATHHATHRIGKVERNWTDDTWVAGGDAGGSVGVRLRNARYNEIRVQEVHRFTVGVDFHGDAEGTVSNQVSIGRVWDNMRGIAATVVNAGWANENLVSGGIVRCQEAATGGAPAGTRLIDLSTTGNGYTFVNVNLEGGHAERTIDVLWGPHTFLGCRYEAVGAGDILLRAASAGNQFIGGRSLATSMFDDQGTHNQVLGAEAGPQTFGGSRLAGVGDPTSAQDVLTRAAGDTRYGGRTTSLIRPSSYWRARGAQSTSALPNGYLVGIPVPLDRETGFDRIAIEVTAAGEAGSLIHLGVYSLNPDTFDRVLQFNAGTVPGDATGLASITIDQTLPAGWWILAALFTDAPTTRPTVRTLHATSGNPFVHIGIASNPHLDYEGLAMSAQTALPATMTGNEIQFAPAIVHLRRKP